MPPASSFPSRLSRLSRLSRRRACAQLLAALAGAAAPAWAAAPTAAGGAERLPLALTRPARRVLQPDRCVMLALARAGNRLVAGGERGLILVSDDGGRQWVQASVPVGASITALRFANEREGWAVGHMGVVLRSTDGGAVWHKVLDGRQAAVLAWEAAKAAEAAPRAAPAVPDKPVAKPAAAAPAEAEPPPSPLDDAQRLLDEGPDKPFLDIALRPDGSVWLLGAYGLALATHDGGRSWQSLMNGLPGGLPNPEGLSLYGWVARGAEQFVFGEQGLLLHSAAAGQPFIAQPPAAQGSLFSALALRDGTLLLMGLRGRVLRSSAPGAPWLPVQTQVEASLLAGVQRADGGVVLVGAAGQVLWGTPHGQRFRPLPLATRFPFHAVTEAADGALVLAGQRGLLRVSPGELKSAAEHPRDSGGGRTGALASASFTPKSPSP